MACDSPVWIQCKGVETPVPCGKCAPCKIRRVNEWVFRISWEEQHRAVSSHFITLTYDTQHVPLTPHGFMSLRKSDFQKFIKRLRKLCPYEKISYFACGEYGTNTNRPHYHAIVFNVRDPELYAKAWTLGESQIGAVHVGTVTTASIAYTLKYIDKESFRQKKYRHVRDDREFEFQLQSKGLGAGYLEDKAVRNWHTTDLTRNYVVNLSGGRTAMPRYYRTRLFSPNELEQQRSIIASAVEAAHKKNAHLFVVSEEFPTYADRIEHEKLGRKTKFARSLKLRNKV